MLCMIALFEDINSFPNFEYPPHLRQWRELVLQCHSEDVHKVVRRGQGVPPRFVVVDEKAAEVAA